MDLGSKSPPPSRGARLVSVWAPSHRVPCPDCTPGRPVVGKEWGSKSGRGDYSWRGVSVWANLVAVGSSVTKNPGAAFRDPHSNSASDSISPETFVGSLPLAASGFHSVQQEVSLFQVF